MAADLARRAALTVDNARLYEREHEVAEALQRSLLPQLPEVPGLDRAARYLPGSTRGAGRRRLVRPVPRCPTARSASPSATSWATTSPPPRRWASCARCCARTPGRAAARRSCSTTSTSSCRAWRWPSSPPRSTAGSTLPADGRPGTLRLANAGHLPPVLRRPTAPPRCSTARSRCSSAPRSAPTRDELTVELVEPGSLLVLYTDGLVEQRGLDPDAGLERLRAAVEAVDGADAETRLRRSCCRRSTAPTRDDDVALLVVRVL